MTLPRLEVLGPFRLRAGDREVTGFATDKVRALLSYLALEPDQVHPRTSLATLLWPNHDDTGARNNLRKGLHQLRQVLDRATPGGSAAILEVSRHSVRLRPGELAVDAIELAKLLDLVDGHGHGHLHTCGDCLAHLAQAAALFGGELLTGFGLSDAEPFEEWLQVRREVTQQRLLGGLFRATAAHLRRGEAETARDLAARQVALGPWREEAYVQLMEALALAGQRSAALAAYERCREALAEELGVEPQPDTNALYEHLLAGTETGLRGTQQVATFIARRGFPAEDTVFVGRADELATLRELFLDPDCRLISIVGPGGVGKTRLALRAAALATGHATGDPLGASPPVIDARDGTYFLPLAGVDEVERLAEVLAAGLGMVLPEGRAARGQLLSFLSVRQFLLVLDNFEQLIVGGDLLAEMLAAAPGLRLLVTSRQVLRLRAEHVLTLEGLDYPAAGAEASDPETFGAGQLFLRTARRLNPRFAMDNDGPEAVARICQLVQGLPLAIEMAAAWTATEDPARIAARIEQSARSLVSPWRDMPERHATVESVFRHSWRMLTPGEQRLLAQLAVFADAFDLEAVLAVAGASAVDLAALLDKSLLRRAGPGRYSLHPLLREFAARELEQFDLAAGVRQAHSDHYLGLLAEARANLTGADHDKALAALTPVSNDLRAAWLWAADAGRMTTLGPATEPLAHYCDARGLIVDGATLFGRAAVALEGQAVASAQPADADLVVELFILQARFLSDAGEPAAALGAARSALVLADTHGSDISRGKARTLLSLSQNAEGDYETARQTQDQALAYLRAGGDPVALGRGLVSMGQILVQAETVPEVYRERLDLAETFISEGLALNRAQGDLVGTAIGLNSLATLHERLGRFAASIAANREAIQLFRLTGRRRLLAMTTGNLGFVCYQIGDDEQALACFGQSLASAEEMGARLDMARILATLSLLHRRRGDLDTALATIDRALGLLAVQGPQAFHDALLLEKAEVLVAAGAFEAAEPLIETGITAMLRLGHPDHVIQGRLLQARIQASRGAVPAAIQDLESLLDSSGAPEMAAPLHYELWRMSGREVHRQAAVALYSDLYREMPEYDYRRRLADLGHDEAVAGAGVGADRLG